MSSSTLSAPDLSSGVFTDTTPRDIAVSVRGLSKSYSIAKNAAQHTSAGEAIMHKLRHPFEKVERETFWALNDVSFDIQKGDVVGIIGRNGAGKSTLLKILSRITEPTAGRIDLYGRVGSLLEVGTGFHPELTGRENIFLNGAILGMKKSEIARQFDAIVDFAEVAQFLDTPVKRYSSGMYVRLAFAVAAHLNPEILIVDEVLAVGDAQFQRKCLGKIQDVADSGRTVLFVSHNMATVRNLCTSGILLSNGQLLSTGSPENIINQYLAQGMSLDDPRVISKNGLELSEIGLRDSQTGQMTTTPVFNRDYKLSVRVVPHKVVEQGVFWFRLYDDLNNLVSSLCTFEEGVAPFNFDGPFDLSFSLPRLQLFPGRYSLSLSVQQMGSSHPVLEAQDVMRFEVQPAHLSDATWEYKSHHGMVRLCKQASISFG